MVKTIWAAEDFHGHYPAVALRFFDALRDSPVRFAVSLTGMGSEVSGNGPFPGLPHPGSDPQPAIRHRSGAPAGWLVHAGPVQVGRRDRAARQDRLVP
jgi:hypothetical protein